MVLTRANPGQNRGDPNTGFALVLPWVKPGGDPPPWYCPGFHQGKGRCAPFPDPPLVLHWLPLDLPWLDAMLRKRVGWPSSCQMLSMFWTN